LAPPPLRKSQRRRASNRKTSEVVPKGTSEYRFPERDLADLVANGALIRRTAPSRRVIRRDVLSVGLDTV